MKKHIKFISADSREARLADRRVVLVQDHTCRKPNEHCDLIFQPGHDDVFGFSVRSSYGYDRELEPITCCASKKKLKEEIDACGFKTDEEVNKWLESIKKAEKEMWQHWIDGEVYGLVVEVWDEAERQFKCVDCLYELYGFDEVKEAINDLNTDGTEVFCADEDCGDPEDWKAEYKEFDICVAE